MANPVDGLDHGRWFLAGGLFLALVLSVGVFWLGWLCLVALDAAIMAQLAAAFANMAVPWIVALLIVKVALQPLAPLCPWLAEPLNR
jgi:hypothetical protein